MEPDVASQFLSQLADSTESANRAALLDVYAAIGRGDYDAVASNLTETVELRIEGWPRFDGTWRGRTEVISALHRNFGLVEEQRPVVEAMTASREGIEVRFRETGVYRDSGEPYDMKAVQRFRFEGGQIDRIEQRLD